MPWSSYTRTLLRYSSCFSILPSTLGEPDDTVSLGTLLSECQSSTFDLCPISFEFLDKIIVQPCCDLFEKAKGLSISHSTSPGFLTKVESQSAMTAPRQHDLIGTHIDAVRPNTFRGRGLGDDRGHRRPQGLSPQAP